MKTRLMVIIAVLMGVFCGIQTGNACSPPPVAVLTATPSNAGIGTTVIFNGNSSYTLDDETIVKYEWDWTNDGTYDCNEVPPCDGITTHAYTSAGTYTAKLRVTDNRSYTGTDTCTVHVGYVGNLTQDEWYNSIQSALNDANENDVIEVSEGTWSEAIDFGGVNCTVCGTDPNNWQVVEQTIIDAGNPNVNVVTFNSGESGSALIRGLTLRGGNNGVYCDNSSVPVIKHCLITDNNSCGIRCVSGTPVITNNKIVGNYDGEGVYSTSATPPTIKNSLICKNYKGITLASANSSAMVRNNTIADNNSVGIEVASGTEPNVSNCILWNNTDDVNGCSATYSCISDINDANGVGNITSDPQFYGVDSNGYYIPSTSPCAASGDPNQSYTGEIDLYGRDVNVVAPQQGATAIPNIYKVKPTGTGLYPKTWGGAYKDLQTALEDSSPTGPKNGDWVWVAAGTYKPDQRKGVSSGQRTDTFKLVKSLQVYGGFAGTEQDYEFNKRDWKTNKTILSGDINTVDNDLDNSKNVVTCENSAAEINGFTIEKGNADGSYGYNSIYGGGMIGTGTVRNCTFANNKAVEGGGAICSGGPLTVSDCTFQSNSTTYQTYCGGGGAIYCMGQNGNIKISRCTFISNSTVSSGGAIRVLTGSYEDDFEVENCFFIGNSATWDGGAISFVDCGRPKLTNCVFTNNEHGTQGAGGGILTGEGVDLHMYNCTFYNNKHGAMYNTGETNVDAYNCIFWNDQSYEISGSDCYDYGTCWYFYNCDIDGGLPSYNEECYGGSGNIDEDPQFLNADDPLNHGFAIHKNSPCRDSGTSSGVDTSIPDPAGNQRVYGDEIDMGAYEWAPYLITASGRWDSPDNCNVHKFNLGDNSLVWSALTTNWHARKVVVDDVGDVYVADAAYIDEVFQDGTISKLNSADGTFAEDWATNGIYVLPEGEDNCQGFGINSFRELALGIVRSLGPAAQSVIKLTPAGTVQWNVSVSNIGSSWDAIPLEDHSVIAIVNPTYTYPNTLFKLNANNGGVSWLNFPDADADDKRYCLAVANDGCIYVGGQSPSSANLWKRNSSGGAVWAATAGDSDVMIFDVCIIPGVGVVAVGSRSADLHSVWLYGFGGTPIASADTGADTLAVCTDGTYVYVGGAAINGYSVWRFDAQNLENPTALIYAGGIVEGLALWEP